MPASFGSFAIQTTRRGPRAAWQRWLQNSSATMARDLFENGFTASTTGPFVAQLFADVVAAFQRPSTLSCTDVFCFETVVASAYCRGKGSLFLLTCQAFHCSALPCAT